MNVFKKQQPPCDLIFLRHWFSPSHIPPSPAPPQQRPPQSPWGVSRWGWLREPGAGAGGAAGRGSRARRWFGGGRRRRRAAAGGGEWGAHSRAGGPLWDRGVGRARGLLAGGGGKGTGAGGGVGASAAVRERPRAQGQGRRGLPPQTTPQTSRPPVQRGKLRPERWSQAPVPPHEEKGRRVAPPAWEP